MRPLWAAAVFAAMQAAIGMAAAQDAPPAAITEPVWVTEPARAQLHYPFDISEYRAEVPLHCTVVGARLFNCDALGSPSESFRSAAIEAVASARIAEQDRSGAPTNGREITVSIQFPNPPIPVAVDPPPAPPTPRILTNVTYLERPDPEQFVTLYPPRAMAEDVQGRVMLDCIAGSNGRISCTVVSEDPPGYGFGEASLRVSRYFRIAPQTSDGRSTAGERLRLPIAWRLS